MLHQATHEDVDYLVIGHLTKDISSSGEALGGSAAYAAKTAAAFGLRVGILTAWGEDIATDELAGIPIINSHFSDSTIFENTIVNGVRRQKVLQLAAPIEIHQLPPAWAKPKIVHMAPVLGEVSPRMLRNFPQSSIGVTPQGWYRKLSSTGMVEAADWPEADFVLSRSMAAVISEEDIRDLPVSLDSLAVSAPILALTQAERGVKIFQQGAELHLPAIESSEIDATGAGDIFAAAFFIRLHFGDEVAEAGRVANQLAAQSVERIALGGTPHKDEIFDVMPRVLQR